MNGFINLYKERGLTSHTCVARLRRILGQKKIGHMGTLDPEAEGVLPVALGKATRLIELFNDETKTYRATMRLGLVTDTLDMTGNVLEESDVTVTEEEIRTCIHSFLGKSSQIPPMYSALKKDGKRLYELAREGISIEREPREIIVYDIHILEISLPSVCFEVTCSRGTYIRSICDDAGRRLGCGACMEKLMRTAVGFFDSGHSFTLSELEQLKEEGRVEEAILPMTGAFPDLPVYETKPEADILARNGNPVSPEMIRNSKQDALPGRFWLLDSAARPVGIFEVRKRGCYPLKMVYED